MRYENAVHCLEKQASYAGSLTDLNANEFEVLLVSFGVAWDRFVQETFERPDRKRAYGAGRIANLKIIEDKLLFILFYYR